MKKEDIKIIYPPITQTLDELLEEFRSFTMEEREEIYETINILRIIKNGNNINTFAG